MYIKKLVTISEEREKNKQPEESACLLNLESWFAKHEVNLR